MDLFRINKQNSISKISPDELDQFELLLEHGLDIKTMIELSFKNSESILLELKKGNGLVPSIFSSNKDSLSKNILYLSNYMSLKDSIYCAKQIKNQSVGFLNELFQKTSYSIFIIFFCFFIIVFFSNSILPSMQFYANDDLLIHIILFLKYFYFLLFIIVCLFLILCILIYLNKDLYSFCLKSKKISILNSLVTLSFSILFRFLLKMGLSTHTSIQAIQEMDASFSNQLICRDLYDRFQKGNSLENAVASSYYIDPRLLKYITLGISNGNIIDMLVLYEKNTNLFIKNKIKRMSLFIQLFSYVSVGILVLVVYQIMLMPLNMLSGF